MLRSEPLVARYLTKMETDAAQLGSEYGGPLQTLYLGGGTPSHLRDDELRRLFRALDSAFTDFTGEVTLEADPLTFDAARLDFFRSLGVNRLSVGLQSTQDGVLSFLGRVHDAEAGLAAVEMALASGMRLNVDIIMAVPGQELEEDLRRVLDLGVTHLSVYTLTVEENTPFHMRGVTVDPEVDAASYELATSLLPTYGLRQYEVSNFATPGEESHHNLTYWRGGHYLALGPGASAFLPEGPFGTRVKNPPIKGWLLGAPAERDRLTASGLLLERLITGLRTAEGVDLSELQALTGLSVWDVAPTWLRDTLKHGLLTLSEHGVLRPTPLGLGRLDAVLRAFVSTSAT